MIKALIAGSFDPPTLGHLNIIERSASVFSHLDVVIGINAKKKYLFSDIERLEMLQELTSHLRNVEVHLHAGLTVDICRELETNVIIRGVRNVEDFHSEYDISLVNKMLYHNLETFFLPTDPRYFSFKSSVVKEIASLGGSFSSMVTPSVEKRVLAKFLNNKMTK